MRANRRTRAALESMLGESIVDEVERWHSERMDLEPLGVELPVEEEVAQQYAMHQLVPSQED